MIRVSVSGEVMIRVSVSGEQLELPSNGIKDTANNSNEEAQARILIA